MSKEDSSFVLVRYGTTRFVRAFTLVLSTVALSLGVMTTPANANDMSAQVSSSASTSFSNGVKLHSNIWLETFADSGGCADFQVSAELKYGAELVSGSTMIKTAVTFDPWGVAPSVTALGRTGDPVSASWENNQGQSGAYLSGRLCTSFTTLGVAASNSASAAYLGTTKFVSVAL